MFVASKEVGLEVNAEKTVYMLIYREENSGQSHSLKIADKTVEDVVILNYLKEATAHKGL